MTPVERTVRSSPDSTLLHVGGVLNAEMEAAMLAGVRGTQTHVGTLEMLAAIGDELVARGYRKGVMVS